MPLNQTKRSDYYFGGEDGKTRQFSRVQVNELLTNMNSAEEELRRYYENADNNHLIVEGIISPIILRIGRPKDITVRQVIAPPHLPTPLQPIYTYPVSSGGYFYDERSYSISLNLLRAWCYQLEEAGISVISTINFIDTAITLVSIYKNCQKPPEEHTTLNRYIKPRIIIREHNPFVETLMGLKGAELGEVKAKALIEHFGNPISLFMASVEEIAEIEGFGKKTAEKILRSIGREQ